MVNIEFQGWGERGISRGKSRGRQSPLRNKETTKLLSHLIIYGTDVLTTANRANVNVSSDRTASPHSRLLWHDSILKSSIGESLLYIHHHYPRSNCPVYIIVLSPKNRFYSQGISVRRLKLLVVRLILCQQLRKFYDSHI